jgi:hypothetical protein
MPEIVKKTKATAKPSKTVSKIDAGSEAAKVGAVSREKIVKETKAVAKPRKIAAKITQGVEAKKAQVTPSREEIEKIARGYWVERGYQDGFAEQDWLKAEQQLQGASL